MPKQLLPHQIEDAQFLASRRFAGCFSSPGSGKTLTTLEAARLVCPSRLLIVGPPISLRMWQQETEDHLGIQARVLKTGRTPTSYSDALVCSYEIATKRKDELRDWLAGGVLICDESHALKSIDAKRTKAVLGKHGIVDVAGYAWMLTGTPVTRWNDDLYPFLCRADMDGLRKRAGGNTLQKYKLRYCVTQQRQFPGARHPTEVVVGNRNTDELRDWLYNGGLAVRRELKDVWEQMPPITFNELEIPLKLTPDLKARLKETDKKSVSQLQQDLQNKEPALATIRREIGMAKVPAAAKEIKERLDAGHGPILVGAWHTDVIDALFKALGDHRVEIIDGRTSGTRKSDVQNDFNAGIVDVLIGQIGAMGVSLNLQKGGNVIMVVEQDWSPAIMDQFYARVHRMGQERHVHVDLLQGQDVKLEQAVARIAKTKSREHARLNAQEA
jgi:SNF2 family DNA or RNA helicase